MVEPHGINLKEKYFAILEQIKNLFHVGSIYYIEKSKSINFQVRSLENFKIILYHFNKFKLITQKQADLEFFQQVFNLIEREEHLTPSGLRKIIAIKAAMNRGLSKKLKSEFKNIKPGDRPEVVDKKKFKIPTD